MKCPRCGTEIKDDSLYCEKCGKEIQIVPEFEPEIENSMRDTLSGVGDEVDRTVGLEDSAEESVIDPFESVPSSESAVSEEREDKENAALQKKASGKKKSMIVLFTAVFFICLLLGIKFARERMPSFQVQKGTAALEQGDYETAVSYLLKALELQPDNINTLDRLAQCYYALGKKQETKELCEQMLMLDKENRNAYYRLIAIYEEEEQYQELNRLILSCPVTEIQNQYSGYMAKAPQFSVKEGVYHEKITVKLIANTAGTIYYTLDGTRPNEYSDVYTSPLEIENGSVEIKAIFVNSYGIESGEASAAYMIDAVVPEMPEITPASGSYTRPQMISLGEIPENYLVFYTTDGSDPSSSSLQYTEPIPMPVGNSHFRFCCISDAGIRSEIEVRDYTLNLHAALSMDGAQNKLLIDLMEAGIINSMDGTLADRSGRNIYSYRYPLTLEEEDFYLFREYYEDETGLSSSTGNSYLVNINTGDCYKAVEEAGKIVARQDITAP